MSDYVSLINTSNNKKDILDSIIKSMNSINYKYDRNVEKVIIKPNLCYYWDSSTGYTTDPKIVEAIIDWLRIEYGSSVEITIAEADASAMRTNLAFLTLGYKKLADRMKVKLLNLSKDEPLIKEEVVNDKKIKYSVSKSLFETDMLINVPKLKIMRQVRLTCAMKNIFGCISEPRKIIYHKNLPEAIVGINKIIKPNLTIVDGIIGLGTYPIKLNILLTGTSAFSVDCVAAKIVCNSPNNVAFLKLSENEGLGDPNNVAIVGEDYKPYRKIFPKESRIPTETLWNLQLTLLKTYSKIVGDVMPPMIND